MPYAAGKPSGKMSAVATTFHKWLLPAVHSHSDALFYVLVPAQWSESSEESAMQRIVIIAALFA